jgi:hypothetical protein
MNDLPPNANEPDWLREFEELANRKLDHGSSCDQIHPLVERWFSRLMEGEPPDSRSSVAQAMACLSTEILHHTPEDILDPLLEHMSEDDLALWVEHILLVGRAFEIALKSGDLDDL